jgi:ubiquinone/menaquinone biosynthesis C-methylase UbiE
MKKTNSVRYLRTCRACDSTALSAFLRLPRMPFTDEFVEKERMGSEFLADLDVYVCRDCWTAQTQHDIDVAQYYRDYQYSVGNSTLASRFMRELACGLKEAYYPGIAGRKVLEIGSGDGIQLAAFRETGCEVLGFEPSSKLCEAARAQGIETIQGLFSSESAKRLPAAFRQPDVIMLSYTFDHLPDPKAFLKACRSILNPEKGLLVVEVHDFEAIVARREYCLFEHEHSVYLTQETARQLCEAEGFEVVDFDLVDRRFRRANSLIFVATPAGSVYADGGVQVGTASHFKDISFYENVSSEIDEGIRRLDAFVLESVADGKKIAGYGAGGRGVMTLAAMTTAPRIAYLVDKNPKGQGLFVPKSHIPLVDLQRLASEPVDKLLVFSFGYIDEIRHELSQFGYSDDQAVSLLDILTGRG